MNNIDTGINCNTMLDYCSNGVPLDPPVCHNDGFCNSTSLGGFNCTCVTGYTGQ